MDVVIETGCYVFFSLLVILQQTYGKRSYVPFFKTFFVFKTTKKKGKKKRRGDPKTPYSSNGIKKN